MRYMLRLPLLLAAVLLVAIATKRDADNLCTTVCREQKPECPPGQAPTGQEGCWGCCQ